MGKSLNMSTEMHPLQEGATDINGRVYDSLIRQVDFEIFKESGKEHPIRKIPSGNQQMFR